MASTLSPALMKVPVLTVPADAAVAFRTCVRDWAAERGYVADERSHKIGLVGTSAYGPSKSVSITFAGDGGRLTAEITGMVMGASVGRMMLDRNAAQARPTPIDFGGLVPPVHRAALGELRAERDALIALLRETIPEAVLSQRSRPVASVAPRPSVLMRVIGIIFGIIGAILGYLAARALFH